MRCVTNAIHRRFGLPDHFVNIVIRLHDRAPINMKNGEHNSKVESSTGVRQDSCNSLIVFLFIMQVALTWPVAKPVFRIRTNGVTIGEREF
jgi:hypothetical protein